MVMAMACSNIQAPATAAPPQSLSISQLLHKCSTLKELKQIQALAIKTHLQHHLPTVTNLINFFTRHPSACMAYAHHLFYEIPHPDVVLFNTMFRGYAHSHTPRHSVSLYSDMLCLGLAPDNYTFPPLIKVCANGKALVEGRQVHGITLKLGFFYCNEYISPTLIVMYAECGEVADARRIFDQLEHPCVVSYNAIIAGYANNSCPDEALALFRELQEKQHLNPTYVTVLSVLSSCAMLGALELGKLLHHHIVRKQGFEAHVKVSTALIDMYSKCGSLEDAISVFETMRARDTQAWSTMIVAFAINGHGKKAIALFEEMLGARVRPDEVSFLGLLYGCSHSGLVEHGRRYFERMKTEFGVAPSVKHYGCMVDLLGRAGQLDEAYDFIAKLPMQPTAILWRTLLSACGFHGNVEMGKLVIKHISELEDCHDGDYVLFSNMCAVDGRWEDVGSIRQLMKEVGLAKTPGRSSIEVDNIVHEFFSGDVEHPQSEELHILLDHLIEQIKLLGHIAR